MVNRSPSRAHPFLAVLLAVGVLAPPALLPQAPREETFFEAVDVDVVSIEVVVTDREGKPITGLTKEDFELFENGKRMAVTNFYAEEGETAPASPPTEEATPRAVAAPSTQRGMPADDQRLYLGIFVDNRSLTVPARNRAIAAMKGFLGQSSRPEDRILLASYDGSLQVHRGPTHDPAALDATLAEIARGSGSGDEVRMELGRLLRELDRASLPGDFGKFDGPTFVPEAQNASAEEADNIYAAVRLFAQRRNNDVRQTLQALGQFVDSLSGLPGRKAVLFVSGGLPMRPAEPLIRAMQKKYADNPGLNQANLLEAMTFDATSDMRRLLANANANRVTFYSLAAMGEAHSAENPSLVWTPELAGNARFNDVGPLQDLAGSTGGFAALDPINPGPLLARMHSDLTTYYSLGYVSPERKSGKTQKIEVKVKRPGVTVRHRENYLAKTGGERTRDRTYSAMLLGETRNPLGVAVDLGEQNRTSKGEVELAVTVKFPISNLVLLPSESFHEGRVSVFIGSRDGKGRNSEVTQIFVPIRIPNEQLLTAIGQSAGYQTKLLLRPEPHQVAVGVRDELGNNDATVLADFMPAGGETTTK